MHQAEDENEGAERNRAEDRSKHEQGDLGLPFALTRFHFSAPQVLRLDVSMILIKFDSIDRSRLDILFSLPFLGPS